jgi:SAM-dependent methyltransferase
MNSLRPYILDDAATLEYRRLDLMSKILDPWTQGYLAGLGVGQAGTAWSSAAATAASRSGSAPRSASGNVTAVDINTVLLELVPAQNLTVRQLDVRTSELPAGAYDLVTCRALLHQIAEDAPAVLERMAAAVRPGGWLVVQELDFHLAPTTEPAAWATTWKALIEWGTPTGSTGSSAGRCRAWSASSVSGDPKSRPTCRTSVAGIGGRCTSGCSSLRCAIVSLTVDGSTRQRSTLPPGCWTTRTTGPSAG